MFDLGKRLKTLRIEAGMSQEKLAWEADITPAFVGQLERNIKSPTAKTLEKLAEALNLSVAEFFSDPVTMDIEQKAAVRQIMYQLRDLSAEEMRCVSAIMKQIHEIRRLQKKRGRAGSAKK